MSDLGYRPCVGIMLVNDEGRAFVGRRIDNREGDWWQMPQGGVDEGEDLKAAALRELHEETGLTADKVSILRKMDDDIAYDLPEELQGKLWGGRYRGQRQTWFLARFTGEDADVDLDAHDHPEFCAWQWLDLERLPEMIIPFKKRVYRSVLDAFRDLI
ncbi:RNA pyrophosphohydrolase [Pseudopontixanthobacter vadosimaris]|uniref:RNA pyrophosphohydrolase n=1 Tax=Pseudopontixanthobacter vadosimaris TaxID=2726450 RepID=UPI00147542FF|nr:RNA pyrophosphohydrolase [Pseudopontixanthobacter vadosimaris]